MKLKKFFIKLLIFPIYLLYIFIFLELLGVPTDIWDKIAKWVDKRK